uniref:Lipopolysaccharide assembly protein A domain-containing protein n=1 Tax=Cyanothece sp. (strain PCC 7425 / ATCC 29141) TaxID=395961 RepID=B8HNK8_CYAP4
MAAIAIFSVQNATPVALKFLLFESIQMPLGVLLALIASLSLLVTLLLPLLIRLTGSRANDDANEQDWV